MTPVSFLSRGGGIEIGAENTRDVKLRQKQTRAVEDMKASGERARSHTCMLVIVWDQGPRTEQGAGLRDGQGDTGAN